MADKDRTESPEALVRLWTHEVWRVFADRLINDEDRLFMLKGVRETMKKVFGFNFDTIFEHLDKPVSGKKDGKVDTLDEIRGLMFTDYLIPMGAPRRFYEEIMDPAKLQAACDQALTN